MSDSDKERLIKEAEEIIKNPELTKVESLLKDIVQSRQRCRKIIIESIETSAKGLTMASEMLQNLADTWTILNSLDELHNQMSMLYLTLIAGNFAKEQE
jgi:hypothetical protein